MAIVKAYDRLYFRVRAPRSFALGSARPDISVARSCEMAPCWLGRDPPLPDGHKIGPLVADNRADAEVVLWALLAGVGGGEIFIDVQASTETRSRWPNLGLAPVFETARMYTGAIPPLRLERVFGVTTFELG